MFTCPYCKVTFDQPAITKFGKLRLSCMAGSCRRKHWEAQPKKPEKLKDWKTIDEIPVSELARVYPVFYDLVKINKTKMVRCLKCPRTFESTSGHRICAECTRQNRHIGALANG